MTSEMPIIRKIIQVGGSKAVSLPKSWLTYCERQSGQCIKEVSVEVNGKLIISPIIATTNTKDHQLIEITSIAPIHPKRI
jgi:antitoxin component of MazEF toxin-antitoxin module